MYIFALHVDINKVTFFLRNRKKCKSVCFLCFKREVFMIVHDKDFSTKANAACLEKGTQKFITDLSPSLAPEIVKSKCLEFK